MENELKHRDLVISIDTSQWPLLNLCPVRVASDEELDEFVACFEEVSRNRKEPFVIILDLSKKIKMTRSQRARVSSERSLIERRSVNAKSD